MINGPALIEEALKIRRELAQKNPEVYLPDVALTLNNLGLLNRRASRSRGSSRPGCRSMLPGSSRPMKYFGFGNG